MSWSRKALWWCSELGRILTGGGGEQFCTWVLSSLDPFRDLYRINLYLQRSSRCPARSRRSRTSSWRLGGRMLRASRSRRMLTMSSSRYIIRITAFIRGDYILLSNSRSDARASSTPWRSRTRRRPRSWSSLCHRACRLDSLPWSNVFILDNSCPLSISISILLDLISIQVKELKWSALIGSLKLTINCETVALVQFHSSLSPEYFPWWTSYISLNTVCAGR